MSYEDNAGIQLRLARRSTGAGLLPGLAELLAALPVAGFWTRLFFCWQGRPNSVGRSRSMKTSRALKTSEATGAAGLPIGRKELMHPAHGDERETAPEDLSAPPSWPSPGL